jgi:hypothetical protein
MDREETLQKYEESLVNEGKHPDMLVMERERENRASSHTLFVQQAVLVLSIIIILIIIIINIIILIIIIIANVELFFFGAANSRPPPRPLKNWVSEFEFWGNLI